MGHIEKLMDGYRYTTRELHDACTNVLEIKMAELLATKNELEQAKDDATQSWLDSRPLIDKLEKLHTDLLNEKNQAAKCTNDTLELKSQLQTTIIGIRKKKKEEANLQEMINQTNQSLDQLREEMEQIKLETNEEQRERSRLEQVLLLRRQTLQALELALRAAQIEYEAFGASSANAIQLISLSQTDNSTIKLTQEEYDALRKGAQEQTLTADWRVSVAMEERIIADKSRKLAQKRLQEQKEDIKSTKTKDETTANDNIAREPHDSRVKVRDHVNSRPNNHPKARAKLIAKNRRNSKQYDRSKGTNNKSVRRKKPSIFVRMRAFLARKITLWF